MQSVGDLDRVSRLDDVVRSVEVSLLDNVGYNRDRYNLWKHQCCRHSHCASNAVSGSFHVTFGDGGAQIEILDNHFSNMLGQSRTNPWHVALRNVDILGLHKNWCANMTELALVLMKWVNLVRSMRSELSTALGYLCGLPTFPLLSVGVELISSVHKLVDGSLNPCKIGVD